MKLDKRLFCQQCRFCVEDRDDLIEMRLTKNKDGNTVIAEFRVCEDCLENLEYSYGLPRIMKWWNNEIECMGQ